MDIETSFHCSTLGITERALAIELVSETDYSRSYADTGQSIELTVSLD